jgi:hypothetical protein
MFAVNSMIEKNPALYEMIVGVVRVELGKFLKETKEK